MTIKVYISQPPLPNLFAEFDVLVDRLYGMVDSRKISFDFVSSPRTISSRTAFDGLGNDISKLEAADFVIFGEHWNIDKRCLVENEIVTRYDIPHCEVENLETFFKNYIFGAFKFDKPNNL